jgi:small subunit ribosomal protein S20
MANHDSAIKAHRQSVRRRLRNKSNRGALKTALKHFSGQMTAGKITEAKASLPSIYAIVDRGVNKKVISKNAAARKKSRLTRKLNQTETLSSKE